MTASWNAAARSATSHAGPQSVDQTRRSPVPGRARRRRRRSRVAPGAVPPRASVLEFDGGLTLVGDLADTRRAGWPPRRTAGPCCWSCTQPTPRGICCARTCSPPSPTASTGRQVGSPISTPARCSRSSAMRAGWRTAPSPPGSAKGLRCPTRVNAARVGDREKLTAPDGSVGAVAGAVVGDRDDRAAEAAVLGQQRDRMRVVVLHGRPGRALAALRPAGGRVARVQVAGDQRRACDRS